MLSERDINILSKKILKVLKIQGATLDIFLLRHKEIKALKAQFIKKKTEPNVLAFPEVVDFPHPERKAVYLGEVYLNADILRKNPERTAPLLVHGILHLLGYDHIKKMDAPRMEKLEEKILKAL